MKWLLRIGLAVVLLLVVAGVIVGLTLDTLARRGIEQGAQYALGVPTALDSADVKVFGGTLTMADLTVDNPPGFTSDHFLKVGSADLGITLGSLMQDTIELPRMAFTDIEINLEKEAGKENYRVILDNLQKLSSTDKTPTTEPDQPGKKFVIRELDVTGITVHLKGYPGPAIVKVAPIQMTNVGSAGEPVDAAYITGLVMRSIFQSMLASGLDLPADLTAALGPELAKLGDLGGDAAIKLGNKALGDVSKQATEQLEGVTKDLEQKVGKELGDGIGNLLGGQKKKEAEGGQ
mgnify:CR=1 FL=1